MPSLVRTATWDERCGGAQETCALSPPRSTEEGHARLSFSSGEGAECEKDSAPSRTAAPAPKQQCSAEFQATLFPHMEEFARQAGSDSQVSGVAPIPTPCSSSPAMVGDSCCFAKVEQRMRYRKLAICLELVQGRGRIRLLVKPTRAVPPQSCCQVSPPYLSTLQRSTCKSWLHDAGTGPEAHAHWSKSSEWIREWRQQRRSRPSFSVAADREGSLDPTAGRPCPNAAFPRTRHEFPGVITAAHETRVREDLMTLPGESWSCNDTQRNISFTTAVTSELYENSS